MKNEKAPIWALIAFRSAPDRSYIPPSPAKRVTGRVHPCANSRPRQTAGMDTDRLTLTATCSSMRRRSCFFEQQAITLLDRTEQAKVMELTTSWEEKGIEMPAGRPARG